MATDLTNVAVSTGFVQLLHIDGGVGGSATRVYDGDGTGTPLEISTTELVIKDGSFNLDVASHDGTNGLKLGGTLVTTSAAELNLLDGITAGTVSASKFLLVDSNKDLTGLRNLTATGTITAANFTGTGNTQIGDAAADTVAMNATITTNLIFEGSTDNAYETTLAITDPTADRTWTIPDATDTSVGRATTDTLTNKTLTAPDINTPDIDGGTVDAITSLTVANSVDIGNYTLTANGLTIDGTFTDGTMSIASGSISSAVNGTFSGTVQAEQLTTTDDLSVSGLATIGETLAVTGVATFTAQSVHNGGLSTGALVMNDGSITDTSGTISFGDENITSTGVGTFASLDISGNADIDGTMEADAYTVDGTALNEYIADTVGAMVSSNTETNITVTYEDGDNTLDFVIGTLNQDTTGTADNFTVSANNSSDETVYPVFVDGATGSQGAETDTGLTYNPSSGLLTITGELDAGSLDISGNADIDGTLEADAITVDGTTLAEYITDQAGGMFSSKTESGITVTFQDSDNTVDLSVDAAQTGITSLLATDIKIGEDDQTKIDFEDADKINFYAGNEKQLILEDGALYPGSDNIIDLGKSDNEFKDAYFDGTVTADAFAGPITGAVTGNADTATLATTVTVTDSSANTNFPVVFHNESNALLDDTGALRYNPSTGELLVPKLTVAGTTTTANTVTMEAANAIIFEGATSDSYETTLSIVDPTADHTQYLINQGGYIPVLAAATTTAISSTPAELNILDGATLSVSELNILDGATVTTTELNLIDGGTARGTTAVASGDGILINDGGTMRMTNVDTVSTYFSSHNVGGSNIVTTGALASGSIASGFGTISTGNAITTTAAITGGSFVTGTLTVDDGSITDSDGAISFGDENLSTTGTLGAGAITGTSLTLTEGNITNAGDINADSLSVDDAAVGLNIDFGGNTTLNKISLTDNLADALNITESSNSYLKFVTANSGEKIVVGKALDIDAAVQLDGTFTVGTDGSGQDVTFYSGTSGDSFVWDSSEECLTITGTDGAQALKVADGDLVVVDKIYLNDNDGGEYISGDGTNLTITSGNDIVLAVGSAGSVYPSGDGGSQNTYYGYDAGVALVGTSGGGNYNTLFGYGAGASISTGDFNIAIGGYVTMDSLQTGARNIAIGAGAMTSADGSESDNIAIGTDAMGNANHDNTQHNVVIGNYAGDAFGTASVEGTTLIGYQAGTALEHADSSYTTCIGYQAGKALTSGIGNVAIGHQTLDAEDDGDYSVAVGHQALTAQTGTTGTVANVAVGYQAGSGLTSATGVTAIGYKAGGSATMTGAVNTLVGSQAGAALVGGNANVIIGADTGHTTTDVDKTVIIGRSAGAANMTSDADGTVAIGHSALAALTSGGRNTAIGFEALDSATALTHNIAIGYNALKGSSATTSHRNIAIGSYSLDGIGSNVAADNVCVGYDTGTAITTGVSNVFIGSYCGDAVTTGYGHVAVGKDALTANTTGNYNIAIGNGAGKSLTIGHYNTVMGTNALGTDDVGDRSTAVGDEALYSQNSDSNNEETQNVGIGMYAGYHNVTGKENTYVGYQAGFGASGNSNSYNTAIGNRAL